MYKTAHVPDLETTEAGEESRRLKWSRIELSIECKVSTDKDPFDESRPDCVPEAKERQAVLGQVLSYAELVFKYQHREFHYMVVFLGLYARIVRFDRSGITITPRLKYTDPLEGHTLSTFIARYGRLHSQNRGHDATAERIEDGDPLRASVLKHVATLKDDLSDKVKRFRESLSTLWPWWKLAIHDELTDTERFVLVGRPTFVAPGVVGRGTRGYIGLPISACGKPEGDLVYVKDAWRIDYDDFHKEGEIIRELNKAGVQYVPTVLYHGDVPGQAAKSYHNWSERCTKGSSKTKSDCPLKPHQHYRLVVQEVGKPLTEFTNGWQLAWAMLNIICGKFHPHRSHETWIKSLLDSPRRCMCGWLHSPRHQRGKYPAIRRQEGEYLWHAQRLGARQRVQHDRWPTRYVPPARQNCKCNANPLV